MAARKKATAGRIRTRQAGSERLEPVAERRQVLAMHGSAWLAHPRTESGEATERERLEPVGERRQALAMHGSAWLARPRTESGEATAGNIAPAIPYWPQSIQLPRRPLARSFSCRHFVTPTTRFDDALVLTYEANPCRDFVTTDAATGRARHTLRHYGRRVSTRWR